MNIVEDAEKKNIWNVMFLLFYICIALLAMANCFFAMHIAWDVIEWVTAAFCAKITMCFIAATAIEYIWFTFVPFRPFAISGGRQLILRYGWVMILERISTVWGTIVVLAEASLRYIY